MDWSDVKDFVAGSAPLIGTLLGGPAGGAVGSLVASALGVEDSPEKVYEALRADPKALAKVRELELDQAVELRRLSVQAEESRLAADTQRILAVNKTMRAESDSENWMQWSWRPFAGFLFAPAIILIYFVLPITGNKVPDVPETAWLMWGAVLGVTAWHRGAEKRAKVGDTGLVGKVLDRTKK